MERKDVQSEFREMMGIGSINGRGRNKPIKQGKHRGNFKEEIQCTERPLEPESVMNFKQRSWDDTDVDFVGIRPLTPEPVANFENKSRDLDGVKTLESLHLKTKYNGKAEKKSQEHDEVELFKPRRLTTKYVGTFKNKSAHRPRERMASFKTLSTKQTGWINLSNKSCNSVKIKISERLLINIDKIDIVSTQDGIIYDDEECIKGDQTIEVMTHPPSRGVPRMIQSSLPDMIDGSTDEPRVTMSCLHAITPDNLYQMCTVYIKDGKTEMKCLPCHKIWDFSEIADKSQMSVDEKIFWGSKFSLNFLRRSETLDVTECPKCGCFCERMNNSDKGVTCTICTKGSFVPFSFCWDCKDNWTPEHVCNNRKGVQDILDSCLRKTMEYCNIRNVPSVRLCPQCGHMIEHHSECKQMECLKCHCEFCFVCLKLCNNGNLVCNGYKGKCEVAPIQKVSPQYNFQQLFGSKSIKEQM